MTMPKFALYLFLFTMVISSAFSAELQVGVGVENITPTTPVQLWGYFGRDEPSTGVLDPLMAKTVLFDNGQTRGALLSLDLGRTPPEEHLQRIRQVAKEKWGIQQTLVSAIHTHAAPAFGVTNEPEPWLDEMTDKILLSVEKAVKSLQPAVLKTGEGEVDISYNRRVVKEDGTVEMAWSKFDRKPTSPVEQSIKVVQIETPDGKPIATLVHYPCHPVISGPKNLKITADFPAYMCSYVKSQVGGECVYLQGACGDINPYSAANLIEENGLEIMRQDGEAVGKEVVKALKQMQKHEMEQPEIQFINTSTQLGLRYPLQDEGVQKLIQGLYSKKWIEEFSKQNPPTLQAETSILLIGKQFAWVGFPGEFFDEHQRNLYRRSPIANTYFVGYCNGYLSYFPSIEAAAEGGYGASWGLLAEAGAGERLVNQTLVDLYKLTGKLKDKSDQ